MKTLNWRRSGSQPFAGACPFLQTVHFELTSTVRAAVGGGEDGKEGRISYWGAVIWKGPGKIPGKDVLAGLPSLVPGQAVNDL